MMRLVLGNNNDGNLPLRGKMRMFRVGARWLSSYEYDTLDLTKIDPSAVDAPKHLEVNEVEQFFERESDPRMSTGAFMFAPMESDGEYTNKYFYRDTAENSINEISDGYRTWGAQTADQESVGLQFSLRQLDHNSDAYFDNARLEVSNILWEFSPDGGRGRWYKLYEMPNRANTRVTLPYATNQIKLRAVSNNPEEWVQAIAVSPKVDWQNAMAEDLSWDADGFSVDDSGYMTWPAASGGHGDVIYELFVMDGNDKVVLARTKSQGLAPDEYDAPAGSTMYVRAYDVLDSITIGEAEQES